MENYEGVLGLLRGTCDLGRIYQIDESMVELLEPSYQATVALSSDKEATLPLVLPWYVKRTRCFAARDADSRRIKTVKGMLLKGVDLTSTMYQEHTIVLELSSA